MTWLNAMTQDSSCQIITEKMKKKIRLLAWLRWQEVEEHPAREERSLQIGKNLPRYQKECLWRFRFVFRTDKTLIWKIDFENAMTQDLVHHIIKEKMKKKKSICLHDKKLKNTRPVRKEAFKLARTCRATKRNVFKDSGLFLEQKNFDLKK